MASLELSDQQLLTELTPTAEKLYERHLSNSKGWEPFKLVPYSLGEDFPADYVWDSDQSFIKEPAVRSALFVNLLTEDNLPYYYATINRMFGRESVWRNWNNQWVAEEGRHGTAIRDYLTVTRAIDPTSLEAGRMKQMSGGVVPEPPTAADGMVYVTMQELATRVSHNRTGQKLPDTTRAGLAGREIMKRVAIDENYHHLFYRDLTKAALELSPNQLLQCLARQVKSFEMPGTGIPHFDQLKIDIGLAGIFGANEMLEDVFQQVLYKQFKIDKLDGLNEDGEKAVTTIERRIKALGIIASKETEAREQYQEALRQTA